MKGVFFMSKTVKTVFLLIATLVGIFLVWQLVFNDGGILVTMYNTMANGINGQFEKVAGKGAKILPTWGEADVDTGAKKGFDIDQ